MNAGKISHALQQDPCTLKIFQGFAFPDLIPKLEKFPALIIINTDLSTGPGEHWCAAYIDQDKKCEYFDPLGMAPDEPLLRYNLLPLLRGICKSYTYTTRAVQSFSSTACGHHCIYFSLLRSRNFPLKTIIENFYTLDTKQNDGRVVRLVRQQYGIN